MIKENDTVPEIEMLQRHEFDLDIEEQRRLQAEGDAEVARIREEKEFENLAKQYLAHLIKKECWNDMETKGRGLVVGVALLFCRKLSFSVCNCIMHVISKFVLSNARILHGRILL